MDKDQARIYIVRPSLQAIGLWSVNAEELLMGTAAQESKFFNYVRQTGISSGVMGGFGPYQMEPPTYIDLWNRLINGKPFETIIMSACNYSQKPSLSRCMTDFMLATIMCRIKYLDISEALPEASNVPAIAAYWKKYYNTPLGAGTEQEFIDNYNLYVKENG
jgi:hypothetical protein